jgi:hypothetical protein
MQVVGSVVGSVTGAVITDIIGTSQAASLAAAALGASVPVLIALIGPFKVRLGASLLIIAAGLGITFIGYTVWQNGWRHTTFPSPLAKSAPAAGDVAFTATPACTQDASSALISFTVAGPAATVPVATNVANQIVDVPTGRPTGIRLAQPLPSGTQVTVTLDPNDRFPGEDPGDNVATVTCP